MKGIFKKLEDIFSAVSFAEAGEHETARQMLKEGAVPPTIKSGVFEEKGAVKGSESPAVYAPSKLSPEEE